LSINMVSVEVGRYGRIVLPKKVRELYDMREGTRLIIRQRDGEIALIPVATYENPTEALYGSVKPEQPIDEPKKVAREHARQRLVEGMR